MIGMDVATGRRIDGKAHIRQQIMDILTTPIGSRVLRRDYGSLLPELIDQPFNALTRQRLYAATALAIRQWFPRIQLTRVQIAAGEDPGAFVVDLEGVDTEAADPGALTRLTLPLRRAA